MPVFIFFACLDLEQKSSFMDGQYVEIINEIFLNILVFMNLIFYENRAFYSLNNRILYSICSLLFEKVKIMYRKGIIKHG